MLRSMISTLFLLASVMIMAACGDDKPSPQVEGSGSRQASTSSTASNDPTSTAPPASSVLPPSIININDVDQITEQAAVGQGMLQSHTWSSDPHVIAVLATDGIRLYNTQYLDTPPRIYTDYTEFVIFSPDGDIAISKLFDGATVLWDTVTGERINFLETSNPLIPALHFSPDGSQIVGIEDESIKLWNVDDGSLAETIILPVTSYHNTFYRDDGTLLAVVSDEAAIMLWDVRADQAIISDPNNINRLYVLSVVSGDGRMIVIPAFYEGAGFPEYNVWNTVTGETLNPVREFPIGLNHDGSQYTYINRESNVVVHDTASQELLDSRRLTTRSSGLILPGTALRQPKATFNADGTLIAAEDIFGNLTIFSPESSDFDAEITDFRPKVISADLSEDAQTLLVGYADGRLELWDVPSGQLIDSMQINRLGDAIFAEDDPSTFLTVGTNISRWNADSLELDELVNSLDGLRLAFSPDHSLLAIGYDAMVRFPESHDGYVRVWDMEAAALHIADIDLPENDTPDKLVFSPDGEQIVVGSNAASLSVYTVDTGRATHQFDTLDPVQDVAISPDGRQVAAVTTTTAPDIINPLAVPLVSVGQLWLWEMNSGEGGMVEGLAAPSLTSVAYAPDGSLIAVGGQFEDGGMVLLDAETLDIVRYVGQAGQAAQDIRFSSDGAHITTIGADNVVRVWGLDSD